MKFSQPQDSSHTKITVPHFIFQNPKILNNCHNSPTKIKKKDFVLSCILYIKHKLFRIPPLPQQELFILSDAQ